MSNLKMAGQGRGSACKDMLFIKVTVTIEAVGARITDDTAQGAPTMQAVTLPESHDTLRIRGQVTRGCK